MDFSFHTQVSIYVALDSTLNILTKLKLRVVITINKGYRLNPSCLNLERREKIKLIFYFYTPV